MLQNLDKNLWVVPAPHYEGKFTMACIMKLMVRDPEALRSSCDRILSWGFDRVTVAHGEVLESGGREAFENAFRW
jgi:hypothetical protein